MKHNKFNIGFIIFLVLSLALDFYMHSVGQPARWRYVVSADLTALLLALHITHREWRHG